MFISRIVAAGYCRFSHIDVSLPPEGIIALTGRNGACKSTFSEIPEWVIFNRTARGQVGAQVVNEHAAATQRYAQARIEFGARAAPDAEPHLIGWVDRRVAPSLDGKVDTELTWNIGASATSGDTATDRQRNLLAVLGLDWNAWRVSAHFTPEYTFFGADDNDKREIFDQLGGMARIDSARADCQRRLRLTQAEMATISSELATLVAARRNEAAYLRGAVSAARAGASVSQTDAQRLSAEAMAARREAETALQQRTSTEVVLRDLEAKLVTCRARLAQIVEEAGQDQQWRYSDLVTRRDSAIAVAQRANADLLSAQGGGTCPACLRPGMPDDRLGYLQQLADGAMAEAASLTTAVEACAGAVQRWRETLATGEPLRALISSLETMRAAAATQYQQLSSAADRHQTVAVERHRQATASAPALPSIAAATRLRDNLRAQVVWLKRAGPLRRRLAAQQYIYDRALSPKGVKAHMLVDLLPEVNAALAQTTMAVSDGGRSVILVPESKTAGGESREKLTPVVMNASGSSVLRFNSAGERESYDLGAIAAFSAAARARARMPIASVFINEFFRYMDAPSLQRAMVFLRAFAADTQVFIESHRLDLLDAVEDGLHFEKVDGEARVEPRLRS